MGEEEADPDKQGLWRVAQPQHIDSSPSKMADNEDEVSRQTVSPLTGGNDSPSKSAPARRALTLPSDSQKSSDHFSHKIFFFLTIRST